MQTIFLWMGQKGPYMWPLFPLHFGPVVGQKVKIAKWSLNIYNSINIDVKDIVKTMAFFH